MKKLLSMFLVGMMCSSVAIQPTIEEKEVLETQEIVETKEVHILTDEELSMLYTCKEDVRNETTVSFTYDEAVLLMQIARVEGGDTFEGQIWVAGSIVNRINSDDFPDTLLEVVSQDNPTQFETFKSGKYLTAELNIESHLALAEIEKGNNPTQGAVWFEANSNSDHSWHKSKEFIAEIQGNLFYK